LQKSVLAISQKNQAKRIYVKKITLKIKWL